jgi:site-specific DNA-cytosine methylase
MAQLALSFEPARKLRVVDLCCGAGLASLGFLRSGGYEVQFGVDIWETAAEAFSAAVHPDQGVDTGIGVLEAAWDYLGNGPRPDVVVAGPPCQDDSRLGRLHADKGRGAIKAPALMAARWLRPTWIVMEMVSAEYVDWAREEGARQVLKLRDCDLGGSTIRTRWFAVWGPRDLEVRPRPCRPWNEALGVADQGAVLATDVNGRERWRLAKRWGEPAQSVVGHGSSHQLRLSDGTVRRLTPAEEAALQGHPDLPLDTSDGDVDPATLPYECVNGRWERVRPRKALAVRTAQTLVGNGWPSAFGRALGEAILEATAGDPDSLPEVGGWEELDVDQLAEAVRRDRRRG